MMSIPIILNRLKPFPGFLLILASIACEKIKSPLDVNDNPAATKIYTIAFVSDREGPGLFQVYTMNSDGSGQKRLTDTPGYNFCPRFTPDGNRIFFMTHRAGTFDIFSMDLEGKDQIPVYDSATGHAIFSQFSPDGLKMGFCDDNVVSGVYHLFIANPDGSDPQPLTSGSHSHFFPCFQP